MTIWVWDFTPTLTLISILASQISVSEKSRTLIYLPPQCDLMYLSILTLWGTSVHKMVNELILSLLLTTSYTFFHPSYFFSCVLITICTIWIFKMRCYDFFSKKQNWFVSSLNLSSKSGILKMIPSHNACYSKFITFFCFSIFGLISEFNWIKKNLPK